MPTYEYQAEKSDGTFERGVVIGTSLDGAAKDLAAKGVRVTQIGLAGSANDPIPASFEAPRTQPGRERSAAEPVIPVLPVAPPTEERSYVQTSVVGPLIGSVGLNHLAFFFRQAATMLHAGVPIVQALTTLTGQAHDPKLRSVLREITQHVEAGRPISVGLQRYPEVFSPVILSMVRAGEEGGFLDQSLETVADYLEQEIELRNLYKRVTFWPKLQVGVSIIVVIGANAIIDSIRPESQHLWSPLTDFKTWIWLGPLVVATFLFLRVGLANFRVKYNWDMIASMIPYLGNTLRQIAMARFGRAFAALYKSGVPVQKAFEMSADAAGNEYLRSRMVPAFRKLESGGGITDTLRETGAFSPIVLDMVATGETTGSLDQMLNKMSDFYVGEAKVRQTQLGYVVGIALGLLVAIYIGYVVINFWTTYYGGVSGAAGG